MSYRDEVRSIIASKSFCDVNKLMQRLLDTQCDLSQNEVELLMAAYALNKKNWAQLISNFPGIEVVVDNKYNASQLYGKKYLSQHASNFVKQYRKSIVNAPEYLKSHFFKIFSIKFFCAEEERNFRAHGGGLSYTEGNTKLEHRAEIASCNEEAMIAHLSETNNDYVFIAGTGASAQLCVKGGREFQVVSNWENLVALLRSDIEEFIKEPLKGYFESWYPTCEDRKLSTIERGHMLFSMIKVYNLYYQKDIEYTCFLFKAFDSVAPCDPVPALVAALQDCQVPIATTNYDTLLEKCSKRFQYNLPDMCTSEDDLKQEIVKLSRNHSDHVYHLHGLWHSKSALTLGVEYAHSDLAFKNSMRVLTSTKVTRKRSFVDYNDEGGEYCAGNVATKPVVFLGTKTGVFDPHFLPWLRSSAQKHYILVRDKEFDNMVDNIAKAGLTNKLIPVNYGTEYEHLADFVRNKMPVRT